MAQGGAVHLTRLAAYTDDDLRMEWEAMRDTLTVLDPIPVQH